MQIIVTTPNHQTNNPKEASSHVTNMLLLRNVVRSIPSIQRALQGCESTLLRTIQGLLNDENLYEVEGLLARSLNDDAGLGKVMMIITRIFSFILFSSENRPSSSK